MNETSSLLCRQWHRGGPSASWTPAPAAQDAGGAGTRLTASPLSFAECSDFSPPVTVILLIFLCLEGLLFFTFTAVMFGTQIHSICNDETVRPFSAGCVWPQCTGVGGQWMQGPGVPQEVGGVAPMDHDSFTACVPLPGHSSGLKGPFDLKVNRARQVEPANAPFLRDPALGS